MRIVESQITILKVSKLECTVEQHMTKVMIGYLSKGSVAYSDTAYSDYSEFMQAIPRGESASASVPRPDLCQV